VGPRVLPAGRARDSCALAGGLLPKRRAGRTWSVRLACLCLSARRWGPGVYGPGSAVGTPTCHGPSPPRSSFRLERRAAGSVALAHLMERPLLRVVQVAPSANALHPRRLVRRAAQGPARADQGPACATPPSGRRTRRSCWRLVFYMVLFSLSHHANWSCSTWTSAGRESPTGGRARDWSPHRSSTRGRMPPSEWDLAASRRRHKPRLGGSGRPRRGAPWRGRQLVPVLLAAAVPGSLLRPVHGGLLMPSASSHSSRPCCSRRSRPTTRTRRRPEPAAGPGPAAQHRAASASRSARLRDGGASSWTRTGMVAGGVRSGRRRRLRNKKKVRGDWARRLTLWTSSTTDPLLGIHGAWASGRTDRWCQRGMAFMVQRSTIIDGDMADGNARWDACTQREWCMLHEFGRGAGLGAWPST
jgi:hypothetical protein